MKKIIALLSAVLIFLLILTVIISNLLNKSTKTAKKDEAITSVPYNYSNNNTNKTSTTNNTNGQTTSDNQLSNSTNKQTTTNNQTSATDKNSAFITDTQQQTNSSTASTKSVNSLEGGDLVSESELLKNSLTKTPVSSTASTIQNNPVLEFYKIVFDVFLTPQPTSIASNKKSNNKDTESIENVSSKTYNGLVYYPQCGGAYDSYPLPGGSTICHAGCGPTSAAMVLSSFIDNKFTPPYVVNLYQENGQPISGNGSTIASAKLILEKYGLQTTDYLIYGNADASEVATDFKNYLDGGYVIFVLARYIRANGSLAGHFFVVSGVEDGKIMAFDPYYGSGKELPFNENVYSPSPRYAYAFGVKK